MKAKMSSILTPEQIEQLDQQIEELEAAYK